VLALAGGGSWPPSHRRRTLLGRMSLEYACGARHQRTRADRLTQCRQVCLRLQPPIDVYQEPALRDARAEWKRTAPPPVQVEPADPRYVRRRIRLADPPVAACLAAVWGAFARPSDWLGSEDAGRPPVAVRDVQDRKDGKLEVVYWRTKPDVEGVGRRIAIHVPGRQHRWIVRRLRRAGPDEPLFPVTFPQLRAALAMPLRSIRRGAVRTALLSGVSVRAVMALTGHKDRRTVLRYAGLIAPEDARRGLRASKAVWRKSRRQHR